MKKIFLVIGLVGIVLMQFQNARAQYVTIPDANFVTWLENNGYASCLNGNQIDTICLEGIDSTSLDCSSGNINSLDGIEYFDNLTSLDCSYNQLSSITNLPSGLIDLDCSSNALVGLPNLPNGLISLMCFSNEMTSLPSLPPSLKYLSCTWNQLTSLVDLPNGMIKLDCQSNELSSIPTLPDSLLELWCGWNQITSLPTLPSGLKILRCGYNQLDSLPTIPNSVELFLCYSNQLTSLPNLPAALNNLGCENNQLIQIPAIPNSTNILNCSNNQLIALPALPYSLHKFLVADNPQLLCMPILEEITGYDESYFNIANTGITCLPNIISHPNAGTILTIDTMPICTSNDPCYLLAICEAPTNPSANNITSTSALIKWNMENDAVKYRVRVKNMSTGVVNLYFVNAPDTTKSLTNLSANTTYQVKVRSQCSTNGSILSPWSNTITFTTSGTTNCIYPTNISANPASNSTATISWTPISGAAGYQLRYKQNSASNWNLIPINNGSTSSYTLTSLSANTTYKYQLRTKCSISPLTWSNFSPIQTFTTPLRLGEEEIINQIQLYPNPSNGTVTLTSNDLAGTLYVYDIVGKEILHQVVSEREITLTDLPSGLLTYRFISENGLVKTDKFVVIR